MTFIRNLCPSLALLMFAAGAGLAHTQVPQILENTIATDPEPVQELGPSSWLDQIWDLPLFRLFAPPLSLDLDATLAMEPFAPPPPICSVQALPEIEDEEALAFESNVGTAAIVNLEGLTPVTARALARFEQMVTNAGGTIYLTSAFRPSAYQEHLQAVWDKWMIELRDNYDPACLSLRAEVEEEFTRHQLLVTQRPVPFSDHTRGIGFDASVHLPKVKRRRLSIDALARRAGIRRPDVRRDPVHFRAIGG